MHSLLEFRRLIRLFAPRSRSPACRRCQQDKSHWNPHNNFFFWSKAREPEEEEEEEEVAGILSGDSGAREGLNMHTRADDRGHVDRKSKLSDGARQA